MADPLSIAASIVALTAAIRATATFVREIYGLCKVPHLVEDISKDLHCLEVLLTEIDAFIQSNGQVGHADVLLVPLNYAKTKFDRLNSILSKAVETRLGKATKGRVTCTIKKDILIGLRNDLHFVKSDLTLGLILVSSYSNMSVVHYLMTSLGTHVDGCIQTRPIEACIKASARVIGQSDAARENGLSNSASPMVSGSILTKQPVAAQPRPKGAQQKPCHANDRHMTARAPAASVQATKSCECACHGDGWPYFPCSIQALLGTLQFAFQRTRVACTNNCCRRICRYHFRLAYHFPSYLTFRHITLSLVFATSGSFKFSMRAPRVIDRSHSLWGYAKGGNIRAVQALFSRGIASPFDQDSDGCSALMNMAWRDNVEMVRLLLQQKADPHIPDQAGRTASNMLWTSALTGRYGEEGASTVALLLQDEDHQDVMGFSTLHNSIVHCEYQDLRTEIAMIDSVKSINEVDTRGRTPLFWAVLLDDVVAVEALLSFGASVFILDKRGKSVLHYVRSIQVLLRLLDAGADVRIASRHCRNTALHEIAIRHDHSEVVDVIAQAGAPTDTPTIYGQTPLYYAISYGHTEIAKRLIELGADVNALYKPTQCSALMEAIETNHHAIIPWLLKHNVDYTVTNGEGKTVLHQTARFASQMTMDVLAETSLQSLDAEAVDYSGKTAQEYFIERNDLIGPETSVTQA